MKNIVDLSLILACYNEEPVFKKNVENILQILNRSRLNYEVIFVDDCSRDKTRNLIRKCCNSNPKICRALYHKENMGRGATVTDGILKSKGLVVGYIDIDCEVSPVYISEAVYLILENKADVVIGKRIYRSSIKSLIREILSVGYQKISNLILNTGNIDTESGYKFFNKEKILPILRYADHPHWFWDTQITVLSQKKHLRIYQLPVLFIRRFDKQSSVKIIPDTIDYLKNLWIFGKKLKEINVNRKTP